MYRSAIPKRVGIGYNDNMNTITHPTKTTVKKPVAKKAPAKKVAVPTFEDPTKFADSIVVAKPGGTREDWDNRVYQCLDKREDKTPCLNKGSVNSGSFKRIPGGYTVCSSCGSDHSRWIRDAATA